MYISAHVSWLEQEEDKLILIYLRACNKVPKDLGSSFRVRFKKIKFWLIHVIFP